MSSKSSADKSIEVMFRWALSRMSELNSNDRLALYAEYREWIETMHIDTNDNKALFLSYLRTHSIDSDITF